MGTPRVVSNERRLRRAFAAVLLAAVLVVALGFGWSFTHGAVRANAVVPTSDVQVNDMSTAAYAAIHPAVPCAAAPAHDMSAAAYAVTHQATNLCVGAATDMSTAAYNATHPVVAPAVP